MDHNDHLDGSERQLKAIHAGGRQLIMMVRQRIAACLDKLDEGEFQAADTELDKASGYLGSLANAQRFIGVADGSRLIAAAELIEGMWLTEVGRVDSVEVESCPAPRCHRHVTVHIGEHPLQFHGDTEVFVDIEVGTEA
jgi:hypothetical protein